MVTGQLAATNKAVSDGALERRRARIKGALLLIPMQMVMLAALGLLLLLFGACGAHACDDLIPIAYILVIGNALLPFGIGFLVARWRRAPSGSEAVLDAAIACSSVSAILLPLVLLYILTTPFPDIEQSLGLLSWPPFLGALGGWVSDSLSRRQAFPNLQAETAVRGTSLWALWMLATTAGYMAAQLLTIRIVSPTFFPETLRTPDVVAVGIAGGLAGGLIGAALGVAQWWVLQSYFKQVGWWVLATLVGFSAYFVFAWIGPSEMPGWSAGALLLLALVVGVLQWSVLRGHIARAGWWIAISLAGGGLSILLNTAGKLAILGGNPSYLSYLLSELFYILSRLILPAVVQGAGIVWLLRRARLAGPTN